MVHGNMPGCKDHKELLISKLGNKWNACSLTIIVIGELAHLSILIFMANLIKGKFGIKGEEAKDTVFKEEPVKLLR